MKRMACVAAAASLLGVMAASPPSALAAAKARQASGLQLSVITPDLRGSGDKVSLDVSYKGGVVDTVELYLDGSLVAKRQLNSSQSRAVISFQLETAYLSEGNHEIEVRAIGVDGKVVTAPARLRVVAADLSAPVRIAYPQNGIQVSGLVPIRVQLDPDLQRQKPYVTFFINKEFKVLKNYPPYEYQWDTTKVANGWHLLEAWTQTDGSPIKARPVNVNVNNAAGETRKLDNIETLAGPKEKPGIDLRIGPSRPAPATGLAPTAPSAAGAARPVASRPGPVASAGAPSAEPASQGLARTTSPIAAGGVERAGTVRLTTPGPQMTGGAVQQPVGLPAAATRPPSALPSLGASDRLYQVVAPVRAAGPDTLVVQPGDTLDRISRRTGIRTSEIRKLNNLPGDARLQPGTPLIVPGASFDVAFDGTRIVFDVQPRVEAGIKLAPFRQIFEHTGGRLYWFGGPDKTVRAVNATREIEIKIGKPNAHVNNQVVGLERAPFLESGRTIVPISFIREALDVSVTYDPATGRVLIQSAR